MSKTFTQSENDTIQLLVRIAASLSIIGSIGIISDFLVNKEKRFKSPNRVVFWLSISDFFFSCCLFLARWPTASPLFCTIQGFFIQYFVLCATLWNGSIAINLLITILLRKGSAYVLSIEKYYHIVCWSFPFLVTFPWLFGGLQFKNGARFFNDADMWCWIANEYKEFRMWLFYVPIWVIFLFNLIIYVLVGRVLWNATNQVNATSASSRNGRSKSNRMSRMTTGTTTTGGVSGRKRIRNGIRDKLQDPRIKYGVKTSFYLLGFFLTWIWATTNRLQGFVGPKPLYFLFCLHAFFTPLQGAMNALVYFSSQLVTKLAGKRYISDEESFSSSGSGGETTSATATISSTSGRSDYGHSHGHGQGYKGHGGYDGNGKLREPPVPKVPQVVTLASMAEISGYQKDVYVNVK